MRDGLPSMKTATIPLEAALERLEVGVASVGPEEVPSHGEWGVIRLGAVTSGQFDSAKAKRLPPLLFLVLRWRSGRVMFSWFASTVLGNLWVPYAWLARFGLVSCCQTSSCVLFLQDTSWTHASSVSRSLLPAFGTRFCRASGVPVGSSNFLSQKLNQYLCRVRRWLSSGGSSRWSTPSLRRSMPSRRRS